MTRCAWARVAGMAGIALAGFVAGRGFAPLPLGAQPPAEKAADDDAELARLYKEDQADRSPPAGAEIDWEKVSQRDRAREAKVNEVYAADRLRTGADYYHAAMILQHAGTPDDYLLAHELCVVALSRGEPRAKWLAAATEDRFLMNIGRPQRFATQFRTEGPDGPMRLYRVDPTVTDGLRKALGVPPLAEAKAREAKFNQKKE